MKTSKRDISISEAAEFLGISIEDVQQLEKQELLRAVRKHGKTSFFSFDDLVHIKSNKGLTISQEADLIKIQSQQQTASSLAILKKTLFIIGAGILLSILLVFFITVLFILFPLQTAEWLGNTNLF